MNQGKIEIKPTRVADEFVISGMSGQFPSCRNVGEFEYNLYNKVCMYNDDESRWKHKDPFMPKSSGKLVDLKKFDGNFFGIFKIQADYMDPQTRILLEEAFKAVMDSGVNPFSLRGSRVGVYTGSIISEYENMMYKTEIPSGYGLTGCSRTMHPNRISYTMGLTGPSMCCDTACSSLMTALNLAFTALQNGEIEAAIVGGANLCTHPDVTKQFTLLGVLSPTGKSCPFDEAANGYVRSEAIGCIFIQKKSVAKRAYASIIQTYTNSDGYKPEGITFPSSTVQAELLRHVYSDINDVKASDLGYLEAHGTGTVVGDPEECKAIDSVICSQRNEPLLIGSVKSNCGHAEATSGICSIVKVLLAMENNLIPPNINFTNPRQAIEAIRMGRLSVVSEATKLPKSYVGINSFGFGGSNVHVLLKQLDKIKPVKQLLPYTWPRLVTWASRTKENVESVFSHLRSQPLDDEFVAIMHSAQMGGIKGLVYRGYTILKSTDPTDNPVSLSESVQHLPGAKRPLVWVFSGMGSQWVGMAKSLIQLPIIRQSIERSHKTLQPFGVNLIKIVTAEEPDTFDNILHSFVGNASIQIALVDALRECGISPDFIIGHSVGELGCAYADNCFTAEQMILAAYYRGKVSVEMEKIKGAMAAVGIGYKELISKVPDSIEIACHNSAESCTISGPCDDVAKFVTELTSENIFAKEVSCSNIAYHSRYIAHFGESLLSDLKKITPEPLPRSNKWISSSVPQDKWTEKSNQYSSAEYHTNNLLNSVLFEEASSFLPRNALTIEIAPHSLLQSILKTSMGDGIHVGLTRRNVNDSVLFFLDSLGRLYENGVEMQVDKLYPPISWPVSRGTRCLSSLFEFDHSQDYTVFKHDIESNGLEKFTVNLKNLDQSYLKGHEIDGRVLIPATFYLQCVWRTFAAMQSAFSYENCNVEFENVKFVRATSLVSSDEAELTVHIQKGTGQFEITESESLVATGTVRNIIGRNKPSQVVPTQELNGAVSLQRKDFYKELRLRGYHYKDQFQGVEMASSDSSYGEIEWKKNWVTFMDFMMQVSIIGIDSRNLMLPTKIRLLRIFPEYHKSIFENECTAQVYTSKTRKTIVSGGIEIIGLNANSVQTRKPLSVPVLEKYQFVSHFPAPTMTLDDITRCCIQIILENQPKSSLQIVELKTEQGNTDFVFKLLKGVEDLPLVTCTGTLYYQTQQETLIEVPGLTQLNVNDNISDVVPYILVMSAKDTNYFGSPIVKNMDGNGFLIIRERCNLSVKEFTSPTNFSAIAFFPTTSETFVLLQNVTNARIANSNDDMKVINISLKDVSFEWIGELQEISRTHSNIVLYTENECINGLLGLVNCLRKEQETSNIRCVLIDDASAPKFDVKNLLYENQLKLGLGLNVYRKGKWGTYRHLLLPMEYAAVPHSGHVRGDIIRFGDLSSLKWFDGPLTKETAGVKIMFSSLNFRDIMIASGRLPRELSGIERISQDCILGFEYSGINIKTKKNVMGMVLKSAVSSYLDKETLFTFEVPKTWTLREAATVPVVYITVYWAFFFIADIRKGKRILIHAGSGGVGIAAIRVALAYGLEVFTTVSTPEKKEFLLTTFPTLKENHIGNSRNTSFEEMIMDLTEGNGVDFVLNCLTEDSQKASLRCLGHGGHFLEIGKFDIVNNNSLDLGVFCNELSFHSVVVNNLLQVDKSTIEKLKQHFSDDIKNGIVKPIPSAVFTAPDIIQAFRYLMSGKHIGKVLIQIREDPTSDVTYPISVHPQIYFSPKLVYIVSGGLGGFGLELVDWLVLRGARKVVLSSSRGISNNYQKLRISLWQKYGCDIAISTVDISTEAGCLQLITDSMKLGPIGGVFNLAVVLKDAIFSNQTPKLFQQSFAVKACATQYLDKITRKMCPQLQHFVVFSSVSCGRGNAGQTNYGMANSIMERIIEDRVSHGFPGKAMQWGAVGEVGLVAEMAAEKIDFVISGILQQSISSCLKVLDELFSSPDPIVASMVVAEKKILVAGQTPTQLVMNLLCIQDPSSIDPNGTLSEHGMDSMSAVEIKQSLEREFNINLNISDLRSLTFTKLKEISENCDGCKIEVLTEKSDDLLKNFDLLYYQVGNDGAVYNVIFDSINTIVEGVPIIIIPGLDGSTNEIWRGIGSKLQNPAFVLQYLNPYYQKSLEDIVQYSYQNITDLLKKKNSKDVYIVAHSFGTLIAHLTLELLEKNDYRGASVFIDGSPQWIQSFFNPLKSIFKEDELEVYTLKKIFPILMPNLSLQAISESLKHKTFTESRLMQLRSEMEQNNIPNVSSKMKQVESVLLKIKMIINHEIGNGVGIIYSKILLIKPSVPIITNIDEYYGLRPFTKSTIEIQMLEGNHKTILQNSELCSLINNFFN